MKKMITYFIKYPVAANLIMVLIILFGFAAFKQLKYNFFPDTPVEYINVQVPYPGASPEEVEEGIVYKIEDNLKGVIGVERVTSISKENMAEVTVQIETGADPNLLLQEVKNAIDKVSSFPANMESPVVFKRETFNFAINFAISGDVELKALKEVGERIERDLLRTEQISQVNVSGYPDPEIEIAVTEDKLRAYGLTFTEISAAVGQANIDLTGGTIKTDDEEIIIRARNKTLEVERIKDIKVRALPDGRVVHVGDVATVVEKWADQPSRSFLNQKPSVIIDVQTTVNEDILAAADYVHQYIEKFNEEHDTIKATIIRDGSVTLRDRIDLLSTNGVLGALMVFILLALVLHHRLAFWTALGIPLSFLGMFVCMAFFGYTINAISLFGMIIVVGILVDDGVVVCENIYRLHEEGYDRYTAAIKGTLEVVPSITSGVLTTVVIFSLFFFIEGTVGNIMSDIAFVVISTLLISLVDAFVILPAHIAHSKAMDENTEPNGLQRFMDKVMNFLIHKTYKPLLNFMVTFKLFPVILTIALLVASIGLIKSGFVKTTFFPIVEREYINVSLELSSGKRENETKQVLEKIEASIAEVNKEYKAKYGKEVFTNIDRRIGPKTNQGALTINLTSSEERELTAFDITGLVREKAGFIPEAEKISFATQSPFGNPISISLIGDDLEQIKAAKEELKAKMKENPNLKDVLDNDDPGVKEVKLSLNDRGRALGLSLQSVIRQVRQAFYGDEVQRLQRGEDEVRVWVRYDLANRSSITDLSDMRIRTANGEYPLSEIATLDEYVGVLSINHLDGFREIRIDADVARAEISVPEEMEKIKANVIPAILEKHPGVDVLFEGQSRESARTQESVQKVLPILLLIMFSIIIFTFRSFNQAFIVAIIIPFSLTGVIVGHWIHGVQIGILSFLGIIAMVGVLVNDSLVLINALNNKLKDGQKIQEAVLETGLARFRPIVLTSVTTIAGLSPIIAETSFQAQFLIPMAISLAYGLGYATILTLLLLPSLLLIVNKVKVYGQYLWTGEKPEPESVESAIHEINAEKTIAAHINEI